jgi:hypothetical protein
MWMEDILSAVLSLPMNSTRSMNFNILYSMHEQNVKQIGLTQKQRNLLEKILNQNSKNLSVYLNLEVINAIRSPQYRLPLRLLEDAKLVSVENDEIYGKKFKIAFPYDKDLITDIQVTRNQAALCTWDGESRAWTMPVVEKNVVWLHKFVKKHNFVVTDDVNSYFSQLETVFDNIESYVPIVVEENNEISLKNFHGNNNLEGSNLIEKLFDARKKGVVHWDNEIEQKLEEFSISTMVRQFLKTQPNQVFNVGQNEMVIADVAMILKNLFPCLVVIPSTATLLKMEKTMEILEKLDITSDQISVMFRLPNSTDRNFNQFIKDKKLNNPLSENTKVVFVSGKITKPIFESRMYFHSILSYNTIFPHYGLNNFLKNQANIIAIT